MKLLPEQIKNKIGAAEDAELISKPRFPSFINNCIDRITDVDPGDTSTKAVNVEDLIYDFDCMIDQLKEAIKVLKILS